MTWRVSSLGSCRERVLGLVGIKVWIIIIASSFGGRADLAPQFADLFVFSFGGLQEDGSLRSHPPPLVAFLPNSFTPPQSVLVRYGTSNLAVSPLTSLVLVSISSIKAPMLLAVPL